MRTCSSGSKVKRGLEQVGQVAESRQEVRGTTEGLRELRAEGSRAELIWDSVVTALSRQEKGGWGYELRAREQVLLPWPTGLQSSMALRAAQQARATRRQCPLAYLTANLSLHSPPALIGMVAPHLGRCSHLHPTGKEAQTQRGKGSCPPTSPRENVVPLDMDPRLSESKSALAPCSGRRQVEPSRSLDRMGRGSRAVA